MNRLLFYIVIGASLLTGACQTTSSPSVGTSMHLGGAALPPSGFVDFCKRHPDDCAVPASLPGPVLLDPQRWTELQNVNAEVNRSIDYVGDGGDGRSRRESWDYPVAAGDCEDFALEKRRRLIAAGWSGQNLLIALADVPRVGAHAVLVVVTSDGDYVLDVREGSVRRWEDVNYRWMKRQSPSNPRVWKNIRSV